MKNTVLKTESNPKYAIYLDKEARSCSPEGREEKKFKNEEMHKYFSQNRGNDNINIMKSYFLLASIKNKEGIQYVNQSIEGKSKKKMNAAKSIIKLGCVKYRENNQEIKAKECESDPEIC